MNLSWIDVRNKYTPNLIKIDCLLSLITILVVSFPKHVKSQKDKLWCIINNDCNNKSLSLYKTKFNQKCNKLYLFRVKNGNPVFFKPHGRLSLRQKN